jgi:CheY-like chemotaxis protein
MVKADPGQIEQVIVNLVVNARDAIGGAGRIHVETTGWGWEAAAGAMAEDAPRGSRVSLTVTGSRGRAEAERAPARGEDVAAGVAREGQGLSLSLVRGIIEQIGGHFVQTDEGGVGVTYTVELPVVGAEMAPSGIGSGSAMPGGVETILVAEDDPDVRELEVCILREQGYRVLEADSGTQALEFLRSNPRTPPDLLFADLALPGLDGPQLAEQARRLCPALRVLYASGYAEEGGAFVPDPRFRARLLQKPFMPGDLVRTVREVLDAPGGPDAPASREPSPGDRP